MQFSGLVRQHRVVLVAEVGQNHNGKIDTAFQLIDRAKQAGFTAVKFTKRDLRYELTSEAAQQPYHVPHAFGKTYGEHRAALEFNEEQFAQLQAYCHEQEMLFFATACDPPSVDLLEKLDNPFYKVASRDLTNLPLLGYIARTGKPMLLSTGMATFEEIDDALEVLDEYDNEVVLLQCTSLYPAPVDKVHVSMLQEFQKRYQKPVGLSDHTIEIVPSVMAVALGAQYIEKHITLSRDMKGTDHAASLEYPEMVALVHQCQQALQAMGNRAKHIEPEVLPVREKLARSLVTKYALPKGHILQEEDLLMKSPGTGITWKTRHQVLNKEARRDIPADTLIDPADFE